ncbi:MAG: hypothetical protein ACTHN2_09775 [Nitrobacter sp.]
MRSSFKTTSILINQLLLASASAGERDVELVIDRRQAACDIASRLLEIARLSKRNVIAKVLIVFSAGQKPEFALFFKCI